MVSADETTALFLLSENNAVKGTTDFVKPRRSVPNIQSLGA